MQACARDKEHYLEYELLTNNKSNWAKIPETRRADDEKIREQTVHFVQKYNRKYEKSSSLLIFEEEQAKQSKYNFALISNKSCDKHVTWEKLRANNEDEML